MTDEPGFCIVNTTVSDLEQAGVLADEIVEARLAACVQAMPIKSVYRWKGAVEHASEVLLIAKTRAALAGRLTNFIREKHPYEVPEILVTPVVDGLPEYLRWISGEVVE
ncbi:MAG: divalent-cation tolerance protein CutA [Kiritimatiellae bacterium]|nr:divalent-cation tolerance protein CutA [Kiritimatiellia bacterium]